MSSPYKLRHRYVDVVVYLSFFSLHLVIIHNWMLGRKKFSFTEFFLGQLRWIWMHLFYISFFFLKTYFNSIFEKSLKWNLMLPNQLFISDHETIIIGSGHYPLRSSLKKPKNKDNHSITSETSSKRTRFAMGAEQTNV